MISVRTKICTETCKKAVKSSVSDFAAYVSEILGHFHLCLTEMYFVSITRDGFALERRFRGAFFSFSTNRAKWNRQLSHATIQQHKRFIQTR